MVAAAVLSEKLRQASGSMTDGFWDVARYAARAPCPDRLPRGGCEASNIDANTHLLNSLG